MSSTIRVRGSDRERGRLTCRVIPLLPPPNAVLVFEDVEELPLSRSFSPFVPAEAEVEPPLALSNAPCTFGKSLMTPLIGPTTPFLPAVEEEVEEDDG